MDVLSIKGRRIIPIRAIPEVTGRQCPPDDLARILAGTAPNWRPSVELQAYHRDSTGDYYPVPPRDWDTVVQDLSALEHKLQLDQEVDDENHPLWRKCTAEIIPSATFAWWDEFEVMINQLFPPHMDELLKEQGYRSGLFVINEHPIMSEDLADLVYQGFEALRADVPAALRTTKRLRAKAEKKERDAILRADTNKQRRSELQANKSEIPTISEELAGLVYQGIEALMARDPKALPTKRERRKAEKAERDAIFCAAANKLRRNQQHPKKSETWIAKQLAKDKTINTQKLTPETIRHIIRKKEKSQKAEKIVGEEIAHQLHQS